MSIEDALPRFSQASPATLGSDVTIGIAAYGNYPGDYAQYLI